MAQKYKQQCTQEPNIELEFYYHDVAYSMTKYANILKVALLLIGREDGKGLIVTNQMTYFGPIMEIFLDIMKESTFLISKTNTATIVHPQTSEKSYHCILCTHVYYMEYHC